MFESRCGVCCSRCEGKEQAKCTGCTTMAMPFWSGVCEVKSCCEQKGLDHCGQCAQFPCDTLASMGKEEGFDPGAKIAQCRVWANEEAAVTRGQHL